MKFLLDKGFVSISRKWKKGDKVELKLPMPVRFSHAINEVKADNDRVAISRGPLVYCAEGVDNSEDVNRYYLTKASADAKVQRADTGILKGIDLNKKCFGGLYRCKRECSSGFTESYSILCME